MEEIKRRLPMMDLLERSGVQMRRSGSGFVGRCPFHDEKTGSFNVGSQRPDRAHCYGCGWSGDVVQFWMQSRGLEFLDAVAQLFEPRMASFATHMVLLTFVETKVRPAAGSGKTILRCFSNQYFRDTYANHPRY